MRTAPAREPGTEADVIAALSVARRVASARPGTDADEVEEVVQETAARVLEAGWRLERDALTAYAVVVARHLLAERRRQQSRDARHAHRLWDGDRADDPAVAVLGAEERRALAAALARLPDDQRTLLIEHEVRGVDLGTLAETSGVSAGAMAARLARARAALRVDYALAVRRLDPASPRCRPVLRALSLGDARRQRSIQAGAHLLGCPVCASVAPGLLARERSLLAVGPLLAVLLLIRPLARRVPHGRRADGGPSAAPAAGVVLALAVAAVLAVVLLTRSLPREPPAAGPPPAPAAPRPLDAAGLAAASSAGGLPGLAGRPVRARLVVVAVPADEGFWADAAGRRVWVQLLGRGESSTRVVAGGQVDVAGEVWRTTPGFPRRVGVSEQEGAADLAASGAYVAVPQNGLRLRGGPAPG